MKFSWDTVYSHTSGCCVHGRSKVACKIELLHGGLTFCFALSRAEEVWSMAFTANAFALSVKLAFWPAWTAPAIT